MNIIIISDLFQPKSVNQFSALYVSKNSTTGTDIGSASTGLTTDGIHNVKEQRDWFELSINFQLSASHSFIIGVSSVISGSNTGKSEIIYRSYSYLY